MSDADPKKKVDPKIEQAGASDENIQDVHAILLREKAEPSEGYSPMPLFVLGFVSAMIFIGAIYFVRHRGGFDPLAYDDRYSGTPASKNVSAVPLDPVQQGKKLFATTCATCHQLTGTGVPGAFPPLAKSEWVNGPDERTIRIVLHGLSGEVKVEGSTFNAVMPAFGLNGGGYNWTDDKIAAVLTYVRQEWGNTGGPVTTEKVTEIRTKAAADRKTPWSAAELMEIK